MPYGRYKRRPYARRPRKYTRRPKRTSMSKPSYRKTRQIVKSVLNQQIETKRHTQTYSGLFVAANGALTSTDGHQLINVSMPSVGTAQNQRIGNKIKATGLIFNFNVQAQAAANNNYPLTGRVYLLMYKDGGTSFPIGNFLDNDPNRGSITYNSLRNPDFFTDFVVLRTMTIRLSQDNYTANFDSKSYSMRWKGNVPITITSTTPTDNSLFLLFVADTGFTSNSAGNPTNCFFINGQSMMYYKDA